MARKRKANKNDLSFAYSVSGPRGMSKAKVFTAAIKAVKRGDGELPQGVDIEWGWRNSKKQAMRWAPFATAVRESRGGFRDLMIRRLIRDALATAPGFKAPAPIRRATPREIREIERGERIFEEKRESKSYPGGRAVAKARETAAKRSEAARKGWETRRAAAAAKKRAKPAKKGKRK